MKNGAGFLFDSNVLLDVAKPDPTWSEWSEAQLTQAARQASVFINPIIYAEIAPAFLTRQDLDEWLDYFPWEQLPLPYAAGWRAARAYARYRQAGGIKTSPLPDFYIGAHAEVAELTLVTRDAARYRTYFPRVSLVAPP